MDIVYKLSRKGFSRFVFVLLFLYLIAAVCVGCDAYARMRPPAIGGTWISEDPYILLQFGSGNESSSHWYAEMDLGGDIQEVFVLFNMGSGFMIYRTMIYKEGTYGLSCYYPPEDLLISGDCAFLPDWFEIYSIKEDNVYNGKYKSIKFYRHED